MEVELNSGGFSVPVESKVDSCCDYSGEARNDTPERPCNLPDTGDAQNLTSEPPNDLPDTGDTENDTVELSSDVPNTGDARNDTLELPNVVPNTEDASQGSYTDSVPTHNLCVKPLQVCGAWRAFDGHFTKGCKWAPDGYCVLTCSEANILQLFNLPPQLHQMPTEWDDVEEMTPILSCKESGIIYDYAWYPGMSSAVPVTCCFASTSRGNPIHLWDAYTGELRCSYRPYNHLDEPESAYSIAFDLHGDKLYCGFNRKVRVFDVCQPGRVFQERDTNVKKMGQAGFISCIAFGSPGLYAAGSYCKTVGMYSESDGQLQFLLYGHQGGVTHLKFSPDGTKLYSGGRMDFSILCWDVRNLGRILYRMQRTVTTHQRMYFDVSRCGNYVISGNTNGIVTVWDLQTPPFHLEDLGMVMKPSLFFKDHKDCVNGVSLHPILPLYATTSGQRKLPTVLEDDSDIFFVKPAKEKADNSLRLWWVPQVDLDTE